jgi:hypothetical protein
MAERSRPEEDVVDRHLARAWRALAPAPGLSEQVRARLTSSTAVTMAAVGLGVSGSARSQGAWASLKASGKLGAVVGTGLLGIGLISGYLIRDARDTPPPAEISTTGNSGSVVQRHDPVAIPAAPPPSDDPVSPPAAPIPSDAVASAPPRASAVQSPRALSSKPSRAASASTSPGTADPQPGDELGLLRRAERAVRGDNSALALALIGELEHRYPRSSLFEERRAIELMAHCAAGATDARARARRFLNEHPRSVYAGRIHELCHESGEPGKTPAR